MPVTPGWRLRGRTHTSRHPSPYLIGLHHRLWPGSFPSPLSFHVAEPPLGLAQGIHVCMNGRELAIFSSASPLRLPQTPEGIETRVSPSPLRTSPVPKLWHCASYLPYPEIDPAWQTLLSLQGVAQVPIFSSNFLWPSPPSGNLSEHENQEYPPGTKLKCVALWQSRETLPGASPRSPGSSPCCTFPLYTWLPQLCTNSKRSFPDSKQ